MSRLDTLPLLSGFSGSDSSSDRAVFVRVFRDYAHHLVSLDLPIPEDWRGALRNCLAKTDSIECGAHLFALAGLDLNDDEAANERNARRTPSEGGISQRAVPQHDTSGMPAVVTERADVDNLLQSGDVNALAGLTFDRRLHLSARQVGILAERARHIADVENDRRLAAAVLAMRPTRIEMAPLFLEANGEQRWAIALAAQRAELGRRRHASIVTVARETVSRLEYSAIAGNAAEFVDLLGRAIGTPSDLTRRIAEDPAGEPLAIALIAIGAPHDVCVRILTARDMYERGDFRRLGTLARLSKSIKALAARRIVSAIIGASGASATEAATPMSILTPREILQPLGRSDGASRKRILDQPRKVNTVGAK